MSFYHLDFIQMSKEKVSLWLFDSSLIYPYENLPVLFGKVTLRQEFH